MNSFDTYSHDPDDCELDELDDPELELELESDSSAWSEEELLEELDDDGAGAGAAGVEDTVLFGAGVTFG